MRNINRFAGLPNEMRSWICESWPLHFFSSHCKRGRRADVMLLMNDVLLKGHGISAPTLCLSFDTSSLDLLCPLVTRLANKRIDYRSRLVAVRNRGRSYPNR